MKRLAALFLALLLLCIAGCGVATVDDTEEETKEIAVFPVSSSKYMAYASSIPEIIWTTTAAENGLKGNVYEFTGEVVEKSQIVLDTGIAEEYMIIQTDKGNVLVHDYYYSMEAAFEDADLSDDFIELYEEPDSDYSLPDIGMTGKFICTYAGYSGVMDMPAFWFGAHERLIEQLRDEGAAETELPKAPSTPKPTFTPEPAFTPEPTAPPEGTAEPESTMEPTPKPSTGETNALRAARNYIELMPFSYSGLVGQLEYEGYSTSEATYAADNCGADWYEQAAKAAARYLEIMAFSRDGLIGQLEYEGYTHDQAVYGVEQNGY